MVECNIGWVKVVDESMRKLLSPNAHSIRMYDSDLRRYTAKAEYSGDHEPVNSAMPKDRGAVAPEVNEYAILLSKAVAVSFVPRPQPALPMGGGEDLVEPLIPLDDVLKGPAAVGSVRSQALNTRQLKLVSATFLPAQAVSPVAQAGGRDRVPVEWIGALIPVSPDDLAGLCRLEASVAVVTCRRIKPDSLAPQGCA